MKVIGLYAVRNEVDVMEVNLRHHFESDALDEAIVIDNGSVDGTLELLSTLSEELPLLVASEPGPFDHAECLTRMARVAYQRGADWVLPVDADEFWVGSPAATIRATLAGTDQEVPALVAEVVNFVQHRDVLVARPEALGTMTMRTGQPVGPANEVSSRVRSGEVGFVEMSYAPKCIRRAQPNMTVPKGNHYDGVEAGPEPTDRITCLHAPIRARSILIGKLDYGRQILEEGTTPPEDSWHIKRLWAMARERTLAAEWAACSHQDGAITVGGVRHPLVHDDRLARSVAPTLGHLRTTAAVMRNTLEWLAPPVGAYALALDTVPGWFDTVDLKVFVELDRLQHQHGIQGHLFEIGGGLAKSAILFGHLLRAPHERLVVNDVFEHSHLLDEEGRREFDRWYADVSEEGFLHQYDRFHAQRPDLVVGPSGELAVERWAGSCRVVHVDGGGHADIVRRDACTAKQLLGPGGIVAFGGLTVPHRPGAAEVAAELVDGDTFVPFLITATKLYGTWDPQVAEWMRGLDEWMGRTPDLAGETRVFAERKVRRVLELEPSHAALDLMTVPSLEELDAESAPPADDPPKQGMARRIARKVAPAGAVDWYRRRKPTGGVDA